VEFAAPGPDRDAFLGLVDAFNARDDDPTSWQVHVHEASDPLASLIEQYQGELDQVVNAIRSGDADELMRLFGKAKSERDSLIGNC